MPQISGPMWEIGNNFVKAALGSRRPPKRGCRFGVMSLSLTPRVSDVEEAATYLKTARSRFSVVDTSFGRTFYKERGKIMSTAVAEEKKTETKIEPARAA
jgi:hypothetical protein